MNNTKKHKKGNSRLNEDGSVSIFMRYHSSCRNNEYWISVDQYNNLINKEWEQRMADDRDNSNYQWDKCLG